MTHCEEKTQALENLKGIVAGIAKKQHGNVLSTLASQPKGSPGRV